MKFKIASVDTGFCRINYEVLNDKGETIYYCLQDEGENYGGMQLYRSTEDEEPSHRVAFKEGIYAKNMMEKPTGNTEIEILARQWIAEN